MPRIEVSPFVIGDGNMELMAQIGKLREARDERLERQKEKAGRHAHTCDCFLVEDLKREIEDLKYELETARDEIEELQAKGGE